jgi:hypothetical protein
VLRTATNTATMVLTIPGNCVSLDTLRLPPLRRLFLPPLGIPLRPGRFAGYLGPLLGVRLSCGPSTSWESNRSCVHECGLHEECPSETIVCATPDGGSALPAARFRRAAMRDGRPTIRVPSSAWRAALRAWASCRLLDDLPIRILPDHLPLAKPPVVASAHSHPDAIRRRARQLPLGDAHIAADPVAGIAVVDIR